MIDPDRFDELAIAATTGRYRVVGCSRRSPQWRWARHWAEVCFSGTRRRRPVKGSAAAAVEVLIAVAMRAVPTPVRASAAQASPTVVAAAPT
jgi:hypothetical protein